MCVYISRYAYTQAYINRHVCTYTHTWWPICRNTPFCGHSGPRKACHIYPSRQSQSTIPVDEMARSHLHPSVSIVLGQHLLKDTSLDMRMAFASAPSSLAMLVGPIGVESRELAPTSAKSPRSGPSEVVASCLLAWQIQNPQKFLQENPIPLHRRTPVLQSRHHCGEFLMEGLLRDYRCCLGLGLGLRLGKGTGHKR